METMNWADRQLVRFDDWLWCPSRPLRCVLATFDGLWRAVKSPVGIALLIDGLLVLAAISSRR